MATTLRLDIEEEYTFKVIGVTCADEGARFCGNVNRSLGVDLAYHGEIEAENRAGRTTHAIWRHEDLREWTLDVVWNRMADGAMIPVLQHFDFLVRVESHFGDHGQELLKSLRLVRNVTSCFAVELEKLPSAHHLDFD
jgi:hypothetical protein